LVYGTRWCPLDGTVGKKKTSISLGFVVDISIVNGENHLTTGGHHAVPGLVIDDSPGDWLALSISPWCFI